MNILLAFNSNYYMPALVLLQSLLVNNRWCRDIRVYVLYADLKPEEIPEQSGKPEQPEQGTEAAVGSPAQGRAEWEQVHSAYRSQSTAAQPAASRHSGMNKRV